VVTAGEAKVTFVPAPDAGGQESPLPAGAREQVREALWATVKHEEKTGSWSMKLGLQVSAALVLLDHPPALEPASDAARECLAVMISYLGHTDQDADHGWMVKKMREAYGRAPFSRTLTAEQVKRLEVAAIRLETALKYHLDDEARTHVVFALALLRKPAQLAEAALTKAGAIPQSSACKREPWCVLQVDHAGECSPTFEGPT